MENTYTPSEIKEEVRYTLDFFYDQGFGMSFDCDEHGKLLPTVPEQQRLNYEECMKTPNKFSWCFNKLTSHVVEVKIPATVVCVCGEKIELYNQYMGACQCPNERCGQWWNLFGQKLKPLEHWNDFGEMDDYDD